MDDMIAKGNRVATLGKQELTIMDQHLVPNLKRHGFDGSQEHHESGASMQNSERLDYIHLSEDLGVGWNDWEMLEQSLMPSAAPVMSLADILSEDLNILGGSTS